jgi:hypothetical protein
MELKTKNEKLELIIKNEENNNISDDEISLAEIIHTLFGGKWLIALILVISIVGTYIVANYLNPYSYKTRMIFSLNYDGAEQGLDPQGRKLDLGKMKAPVVVNPVVEKLGLEDRGIFLNDIIKNIELIPVIPGNVTEKIKALEEAKKQNIQDVQSFVFYPTTYEVKFNVPKDMKISQTLSKDILYNIVQSYEEYFHKEYSQRNVLANTLGELDYSGYDYPEISTVVHNQINMLQNFVGAKMNETAGREFRSSETGIAFIDIYESVDVIKEVDLARMDSIIGAFNLTKNKEKLIKLYEYKIKQYELSKNKKEDESKVASDMMNVFKKGEKTILLPGISNTDGMGQMLQEDNTYYDQLAQRSTDAGVESKTAARDIEYYTKEIEKLQNDTISTAEKEAATNDVTSLIDTIKTKMNKWINITNTAVEEYYEKTLHNTAIKYRQTPENYSPVGDLKMTLAIAAVLGLMLGSFIVFIRAYLKKNKPVRVLKSAK